ALIGPLERAQLPSAPGEMIHCITRGLFFLHFEEKPIVIAIQPGQAGWMPPHLELLAHEQEVAQVALSRLLKEVYRNIVYKGKTLYLENRDELPATAQHFFVRFQEMPPISGEEIVLPEAVRTAIERNALSLLKPRKLLSQAGRPTR